MSRGGDFETAGAVFLVAGGYRWKPFDVDLSAWGGERVTLRLALTSDAPLDPDVVAFWGSPRIALPPPADGGGKGGERP